MSVILVTFVFVFINLTFEINQEKTTLLLQSKVLRLDNMMVFSLRLVLLLNHFKLRHVIIQN